MSVAQAIDTIRSSEEDVAKLLDELDSASCCEARDNRRGDVRVPYRVSSGVMLSVPNARGSVDDYRVVPRNLGGSGIAVLHGTFVYTNTTCAVRLKKIDGSDAVVKASVMHCRSVRGRIHELGLRFDERIDVSDFVKGQAAAAPATKAEPVPTPETEPITTSEPTATPDATPAEEPAPDYNPHHVRRCAAKLIKLANAGGPLPALQAILEELTQGLQGGGPKGV